MRLAIVLLAACHSSFELRPVQAMAIAGDRLVQVTDVGDVFASTLAGTQLQQIGSTSGNASEILFATAETVYWVGPDADQQAVFRTSGSQSVATAVTVGVDDIVDLVDDVAAYTGDEALVRQPLDGGPATTLTSPDHLIVSAARLDDTIYFGTAVPVLIDNHSGGIWRVGIDGSDETQLVQADRSALTVAVAPTRLFWADDSDLFGANLDGTDVTVLEPGRTDNLQIVDQRLFFQSGSSVVSRALDGSDRQIHYTAGDLEAFAVGDHVLYVEDLGALVTATY